MSRQTQAIIHADAVLQNFRTLSSMAKHSQSLAVIKADAYGHGAIKVARILQHVSPRFAVAIIEEAVALREAGITVPIVVLEGAHQAKECAMAAQYDCILVMHSYEQLQWMQKCEVSKRPHIWLKVDSGMHRLGFSTDDIVQVVAQNQSLLTHETTLVTHFACADDPDNDFTATQIAAFEHKVASLSLPVSLANSPASVNWPQSQAQWNRLGVGVYGGEVSTHINATTSTAPQLFPAMTLRSSVIALRDISAGEGVGYGQAWRANKPSKIATVGIGYADGYPRHCPSGTPVLVRGQRASLVGRVSMDMITIDVTHINNISVGDTVELWGENISISEVASCAGTIDYELMTRVSSRVPRIVRYA